MMGASSPTAPWTRTALPIVVPMTPASMRMGSRVPIAVEVSAIASAMYVAVATPLVPDAATATQEMAMPIPKHASHVSSERLPARPCTSSTSISVPAMRKSMPMPTSRNTEIGSVRDASPRTFGPMMAPRMSSQTTSGTRLRVSEDSRGAMAAAAAIRKRETMAPSVPLVLDAATRPWPTPPLAAGRDIGRLMCVPFRVLESGARQRPLGSRARIQELWA